MGHLERQAILDRAAAAERRRAMEIADRELAAAFPESWGWLAVWHDLRKRLRKTGRILMYRSRAAFLFVTPADRDAFLKHNPWARLMGRYDRRTTRYEVRDDIEGAKW